ncbi:c-type cytochrome [Acuticoccus kandeliae]|uniref:c-type cytochrome n=1 Tax=Acuticoccus kandeliae TaxID=2073160 RepID=UPI0013006B3B|nr:c-type cytochrome [Acuticoccus kandeliae]
MSAGLNGTGVAIVALALALPVGAKAADPAIAKGLEIARTWCSACHAIGDDTQAEALADAPAFAELAVMPGFDEGLVAYALLQPHPVMPNFPLTRSDIRAIAAYIESLKPEQRSDAGGAAPIMLAGNDPAPADDAAQVHAGEVIAARDCGPCHTISGDARSPVEVAPPFPTLSENYPVEFLEEALAEGIMVNHPTVEMPQYVYEPDEIAALMAFLKSVQLPQ